MIAINRTHQLGGMAFVLGNLLFLVNKLDEMSRLFLGRWMPDLISGQNPVLILLGQVALIIGYVQSHGQGNSANVAGQPKQAAAGTPDAVFPIAPAQLAETTAATVIAVG